MRRKLLAAMEEAKKILKPKNPKSSKGRSPAQLLKGIVGKGKKGKKRR